MSTTRGGNSLFYPSFWANDYSVGNGYIRIRKKGDDTLTVRVNTWTTMTRNIDCGPCGIWGKDLWPAVCGFLG